jgi:hypothetical protein
VALSDFLHHRAICAILIEEIQMAADLKERLMIMLPVNVNQLIADGFQERKRGETVVDEDSIPSGRGDLPPDHE